MRKLKLNLFETNTNSKSNVIMQAQSDHQPVSTNIKFTSNYRFSNSNSINPIYHNFKVRLRDNMQYRIGIDNPLIIDHCTSILYTLINSINQATRAQLKSAKQKLIEYNKTASISTFNPSGVIHAIAMDNCTGKTTLANTYPNLFIDIDQIKTAEEQEQINEITKDKRVVLAEWVKVDRIHSRSIDRHISENPEDIRKILLIHNFDQIRFGKLPIIAHAHLMLDQDSFNESRRDRINQIDPTDQKKVQFLMELYESARSYNGGYKISSHRSILYFFITELITALYTK